MPCGYVYPTVIEARERFSIVIFIFRVRPLHFARSTPKGNTRASISGMSNGKVLTHFFYWQNRRIICQNFFQRIMKLNSLRLLILTSIVCASLVKSYAHYFEVNGIYYENTNTSITEVDVRYNAKHCDYGITESVTCLDTTYSVTTIKDENDSISLDRENLGDSMTMQTIIVILLVASILIIL